MLCVFWSVKPKPLIIILLQECGGQFRLFQRLQRKQAITQIKVCSTWKTSPSEQELFNLAFLNVFEFCTRERTLLLQVIAPHKKEETPSMKDGRKKKLWNLQEVRSPELSLGFSKWWWHWLGVVLYISKIYFKISCTCSFILWIPEKYFAQHYPIFDSPLFWNYPNVLKRMTVVCVYIYTVSPFVTE